MVNSTTAGRGSTVPPALQFLVQEKWLWLGLALQVAVLLQPGHLCYLLCSALLWVQAQESAGVIAYIGIYNLAKVLFIPGALLTLGVGAIYGVLWESVYALGAATLGATRRWLYL